MVNSNNILNSSSQKPGTNHIWFYVVLCTGLAARFGVATWGHNYDFESYRIVADLMAQGKSVYANTTRYNYGPIWFTVIRLLDMLSGRNVIVFHWLLVALLSAADVGIFFIIWRKFGRCIATMFFLNPVSIIVTGYTNQFDNLAILIGLCAVLVMGDEFEKPLSRRKVIGLLLLGLSLVTKHVLFAFPIWLAMKQKGLISKLTVIVVPVIIFLAAFVPYWSSDRQGIINNVFEYRSLHNHVLYSVLPIFLQYSIGSQNLWLSGLALFAYVCRRMAGLESLAIYLAVLVAASPAVCIQYLAIPLIFIASRINLLTIAYTIAATLILMGNANSLHLPVVHVAISVPIYILTLAIIWSFWQLQITGVIKTLGARLKGRG